MKVQQIGIKKEILCLWSVSAGSVSATILYIKQWVALGYSVEVEHIRSMCDRLFSLRM